MEMVGGMRLAQLFNSNPEALFAEWFAQQHAIASRRGLVGEAELRNQFAQFVALLTDALGTAERVDFKAPAWQEVRAFLADMSAQRARQGFTPVETAMFVFSLKQPLFVRLRESLDNDPATLADLTWMISTLFDELGLYTTEVFQASREQVIVRQQQELLELSTPVVQLWDGILALPLIGTLDSARTQVVMENLLQKIVETGAAISIIDITGVPTVDTLVAQHLLKTVAAARLMGADCIISGIRPQIAQTIVHLGVNLSNVTTKATLAAAFVVALQRTGKSVAGNSAPDASRASAAHDSLQPE
ncbi:MULTISPECIES: STAS domain-containing protein [unclassified Caballeronia]|uniref:STAS domain-containing protein n=1 Tax=unclassified Caballeronia TaxID=2646786 RepID=UPI0028570FEB|nr:MULTISPECIES: STAS domain-containing protein [unclassified Caballeronia]MDR5817532.1 STAS domain-containing protein [Caballeronia sp. LZ033]MDR5824477.1 STAS domain-containing protein [Caballeronia sp. LZ043]MDR5882370.1 STAS domain-containing protein [Caballeronia sp. LZ032]